MCMYAGPISRGVPHRFVRLKLRSVGIEEGGMVKEKGPRQAGGIWLESKKHTVLDQCWDGR